MNTLGHLLWWRIGEVNLTWDDVAKALTGTDVALPARPIPVDVYRRVTTTASRQLPVGEEHVLDLTCHPVDGAEKMITHHLVGKLKRVDNGVTETVRKVGDMAFYKPPRGQHSRSRMRVVAGDGYPGDWHKGVLQFVGQLRAEYDKGVKGHLDSQAIRRTVRNYLTEQGALYLDGPYFAPNGRDLRTCLEPLFGVLGEDSFIYSIGMPDSDYDARFLRRGLERAVNAGTPVAESIWKLVEA